MAFGNQWATDRFLELEARVRQRLTEVESRVLESRLPVTVEVNDDGDEIPIVHPRP